MKTIVIGAALAAVAAALLPAQVASAQIWIPNELRVTGVTAAGSGCPRQTPTVVYSQGQRALVVTMPGSISAVTGPGHDPSESNAYCTIGIEFDARPGYRFAITRATYHGYANLDAGVLGMQTITHWFMGQGDRGRFITNLIGPQRGGYQRNQTAAPVGWSSCTEDRRLNIDFDVSVSNISSPQGRGTLSTGPGVYQLGLTWAPCDGSSPPEPGFTFEPWIVPGPPGGPP